MDGAAGVVNYYNFLISHSITYLIIFSISSFQPSVYIFSLSVEFFG